MNIYIELLDKILDVLESHIEFVKVFAYLLTIIFKDIRGLVVYMTRTAFNGLVCPFRRIGGIIAKRAADKAILAEFGELPLNIRATVLKFIETKGFRQPGVYSAEIAVLQDMRWIRRVETPFGIPAVYRLDRRILRVIRGASCANGGEDES